MNKNNGYVRWWQLLLASLTLLGITTTAAIWGASQVIAIDIRSNQRDEKMDEKVEHITKEISEKLSNISGDIREIMVKLEKERNER